MSTYLHVPRKHILCPVHRHTPTPTPLSMMQVDVGGLEREWFLLVSKELFSREQGLFRLCPGGGGYAIDPSAPSQTQLTNFEFVGRFLGKALLERQSLPVALAIPLYKHILRAPVGLDDLRLLAQTIVEFPTSKVAHSFGMK